VSPSNIVRCDLNPRRQALSDPLGRAGTDASLHLAGDSPKRSASSLPLITFFSSVFQRPTRVRRRGETVKKWFSRLPFGFLRLVALLVSKVVA